MNANANRRDRLYTVVRTALDECDASAFVTVGSSSAPGIRYCLLARDGAAPRTGPADEIRALAFTGDEILASVCESTADDRHPAEELASRLADRDAPGTLLTPRTIPHDAALYLERAGFDLASSDLLDRARMHKTAGERGRIERAQAAASAGIERAFAMLAEATVVDGRLESDGEPLTPERVRVGIDETIVRAGAFPAGTTSVRDGERRSGIEADGSRPLPAGRPITLETAPCEPGGYHGGLVRTAVVDGDGGPERRAHVAITHAFKSARALLSTSNSTSNSNSTEEPTIAAVEADLEAEIRAFGFSDTATDGVETSVYGVGLEACEEPIGGRIPDGCVLRLEAAVTVDGTIVRLGDLLVRPDPGSETSGGARWLEGPGRSLEPSAYR